MEKDKKLLACFQTEIEAIKEKQINECKQELETIQARLEAEIYEDAQTKATQWYEQEVEELTSKHAVEMSRLKDETHHQLMKERTMLVEALFDELKERLCAYRNTSAYGETLKQRLALYAKKSDVILQVGAFDEPLLNELLQELTESAKGEICEAITLGGFRLIFPKQAQIMDESFDSVLEEAKEQFLLTSGLTIA